jgi:hypothetical protein
MKLELAKEFYLDEWTRRDQLTGGVTTPITVMTAVAGALALMIKDFSADHPSLTIAFAFATGLAIIFLVAASYFVARSYHGYEYQRVARAAELDTFCKQLHAYQVAIGGSSQDADCDFDAFLADRFVEAADRNAENNDSKAAYLYRGSKAILFALIFAAFASIPWAWSAADRKPESQRVRLDSPVGVVLQRGNISATSDSVRAANKRPAAAPAAPAAATNRSAKSTR